MWLNSIYGVDLDANAYMTGFDTDLHALANQIMGGHVRRKYPSILTF